MNIEIPENLRKYVYVKGDSVVIKATIPTNLLESFNLFLNSYVIEYKKTNHIVDTDKLICDFVKAETKWSDKRVNELLDTFNKYPDIKIEFIRAITIGFPEKDPIIVENQTAESLFNTGKLNILGAYNYLIYLKEKPEEALMWLEKGLPRK